MRTQFQGGTRGWVEGAQGASIQVNNHASRGAQTGTCRVPVGTGSAQREDGRSLQVMGDRQLQSAAAANYWPRDHWDANVLLDLSVFLKNLN